MLNRYEDTRIGSTLEAMRVVLSQLDYPDCDDDIVGTPDPLIVGPPEVLDPG